MAEELSLEQFNSMVSAQPAEKPAPDTPPTGGKPGKEMSLEEFNARAAMHPKEEPFVVDVYGHGDGKEQDGSGADGGRGKINPPTVDEIQPGSLGDKTRNFALGAAQEAATLGDMVMPWSIGGGIAAAVGSAALYAHMQAIGINREGAAAAAREFGDYVSDASNPHILSRMVATLAEKTGQAPTPGMVNQAMQKFDELIGQGAKFIEQKTGREILADEVRMEASVFMNLLAAKGLSKIGPKYEFGGPAGIRKVAKPEEAPAANPTDNTIYVDKAGTAYTKRPFDPVDKQPTTDAFQVMERNYREAQNPRVLTEKEFAKTVKAFNQFHDGKTTVEANRTADAAHANRVAGGADPKLLAIIGGGTAGYLLSQAYPEKATDLMAAGLAMSTFGIGPERMGKAESSFGSLLGEGRNSLHVLNQINDNHTEITQMRLKELMNQPEVTKAEKEVWNNVLDVFEDRASIPATDLVRAVRMFTDDYTLRPKETDHYAELGLQNINRHTEEMRDYDEVNPHARIRELERQMPLFEDRVNAPEDQHFEDFPYNAEQARFHLERLQREHREMIALRDMMKEEVVPTTTVWSTTDQINIAPTQNHFSADNYFAHTRSFREDGKNHIVELQSDLIQKMKTPTSENVLKAQQESVDARGDYNAYKRGERELLAKVKAEEITDPTSINEMAKGLAERGRQVTSRYNRAEKQISPIEQAKAQRIEKMYKDYYKRLVREELARAARAGDTHVRFATADTMAKVEGWGRSHPNQITPTDVAEAKTLHEARVAKELYRITEMKDYGAVEDLMQEHYEWLRFNERLGRPQGKDFADPGHQSIYDRYKSDIEKFARKLGAEVVEDKHGHTWLETPTGVKPGHEGYAVDMGPGKGVEFFPSKEAADRAYKQEYPEGDGPPPKRISETELKDTDQLRQDIKETEDKIAYYRKKGFPESNNAIGMGKAVLQALKDDLAAANKAAAALPKGKPTRANMFGGATTDAMKTLAGIALGITVANQFNSENPLMAAVIGAIAGATAAHFTVGGVKAAFSAVRTADTRARITGMMEDHQTDFTRMEREVAKFSGAMLKAVPKKADREKIHLAVDAGKVNQLPPKLQAAAAKLQQFYATIAAEAQAAGVLDTARANYSTHLWKDVNAAKNLLAQKQKSMSPQSRFNKQRAFLTMREGIAAGLQPLTLDAAEVASIYGRSMGRSIANAKLIDRLKKAYTPAGDPILIKASNISKATANYESINHPQLAGKRIHPDVMPSMKFLFDAEDAGAFWEGANAVNIALKRNAVTFSLFHVKSLLEAGIVAGHPFKAGKVLLQATAPKIFGTNKFLNELRTGGVGDLVDKLLEGGLRVSFERAESVDIDVGGGFYHGMRHLQNGMDKVLPFGVGKNAVGAVMKFNHLVDNWMWGRVHAALKLEVAAAKMETLMNNAGKRGKPLTEKQAARLASDYTNSVFGGLNWMRMAENMHTKWGRDIALSLSSRSGRMAMNFLLFAPDWTVSTMRAFYKAAGRSGPGALRGLIQPINDVDLYRQQLLRLGFYYGTALNAINLATSGHNIWENKDPTRIELADGRSMQMAKHSFEAFHAMANPGQFAMSKLGIIPKEAAEQALGVEYLSAKGRMPPMQNRLQHVAKNFAPIGVQQFQQGPEEGIAGMLGAPIYGQTKEQAQKAAKARRMAEYQKRRQKYLQDHQQKQGGQP